MGWNRISWVHIVFFVGIPWGQRLSEIHAPKPPSEILRFYLMAMSSCFYTTNMIFGEEPFPLDKHHNIQWRLFHWKWHNCGIIYVTLDGTLSLTLTTPAIVNHGGLIDGATRRSTRMKLTRVVHTNEFSLFLISIRYEMEHTDVKYTTSWAMDTARLLDISIDIFYVACYWK